MTNIPLLMLLMTIINDIKGIIHGSFKQPLYHILTSGSSCWVKGGTEKHEIYAAAFSGILFMIYFHPWICY